MGIGTLYDAKQIQIGKIDKKLYSGISKVSKNRVGQNYFSSNCFSSNYHAGLGSTASFSDKNNPV